MSLTKKLFKGALWNGINQFGIQGINFLITIILARLLSPDQFGLVGMVIVFTGILGYFSEMGIIYSIIREKDTGQEELSTAYWSGLAFGLVAYIICFLLAPLLSMFYKQPELTNIVRIMSVSFLIRPFSFVSSALELKKIRYELIAKSGIAAAFISGIIACYMAYGKYGVYAIVFQTILKDFIESILIIIMVKWYPQLRFSVDSFKKLYKFGVHVSFNNMIKFFSENMDYLLIGKMLGAHALGIYTMAYRVSRYPLEKIWRIFGGMLFPAFSTIQTDNSRMTDSIYKTSLLGGMVIIPFSVFLFFSTDIFISVVLGSNWIPAKPIIRIFLLYIIFSAISFGDESAIMVIGKVKELNLIKLISVGSFVLFGYVVLSRYQLKAISLVFSIVTIIQTAIIKMYLLRLLNIKLTDYMKKILFLFPYTLILAFVATISYFLIRNRLPDLLSVIIYGAVIALFSLFLIYGKYAHDMKKSSSDRSGPGQVNKIRNISEYTNTLIKK
jgi:PST family polysaccharide transporter